VLFFENNNKEEVSVTNIYVSASYHLIFIMISEEASKEFESIPLLAKIVKRRIVDMSDDIEEQTDERIKNSQYFAIQLEESTDVSNFAKLLVFARFFAPK
jgi:hypothetical protein